MSEELPYVWRAYWLAALWRRRPLRLLMSLALVALAVAVTAAALHPAAGAMLIAALVVALDELLLPVSYRVAQDGVRLRTLLRTRQHAWAELTDARLTEFGVLLRSPVRRSVHLLVEARAADILAFAALRLGAVAGRSASAQVTIPPRDAAD